MIYEKDGVRYLEHMGKTLKMTNENFYNITDEEYNKLVEEYYARPSLEEVDEQMRILADGGTNKGALNKYYIHDVLSKASLYDAIWSPAEALQSKEVVGYILRYVSVNKKVYDPKDGILSHFNKAIQLIGAGVCKKACLFPLQTVDAILQKYNTNNRYYDFSCGWGDRLIGSLKNGVNYFGTDPNYELTPKLIEMGNRFLKVNDIRNTRFDIRTQGSEIRIPEWENTMGLAFSSPPYFNLEDYKIGNQSWTPETSYEQWLNGYMASTVENCLAYLVDGGILVMNVKNFAKHDLVGDIKGLILDAGFKEYSNDDVVGRSKRTKIRKNDDDYVKTVDNVENAMVFVKNPEKKKSVSLF